MQFVEVENEYGTKILVNLANVTSICLNSKVLQINYINESCVCPRKEYWGAIKSILKID